MSNYNKINNTCTLNEFYDGMKNVDPHMIKKQSFQQGEIFVIMKSLNITRELLNKVCNQSSLINMCNENTSCINNEFSIDTLIIESNQILTIGYRNIKINHSITLNIALDINLYLYNGATFIIFKENIFINNGNLVVVNSSIVLESNHEAKFINYGIIEFKNSQFFGTGLIINNNKFLVSGYSKLYLGRLKEGFKSKEEEELSITSKNNEEDTFLYDFGQNSSKFINTGELVISGYSLFDLLGYFINGKSDISDTFITNFNNISNSNKTLELRRVCSSVFLKSNSKFLFTIGESSNLDGFVNDVNGLIIFENNTYSRFKTSQKYSEDSIKRKNIMNKGILICNGETYFISVNFENYCLFKNTIHNITNYHSNAITFGCNFNYSKIFFINNNCEIIPTIKNIGNNSLIQISPTATLHIFGYNLVNQGTIGIGISGDSIGMFDDVNNNSVSLDIKLNKDEEIDRNDQNNIEFIKIIDSIKINGEFLFGFMEPNNCINITFKNWGNIYCFLKSRFIIGYNSSSIINGKRQIILFNYGLIRNWGYLKICRFSEIINLPSFPFNINCKLYGIINGSKVCITPCEKNCNILTNSNEADEELFRIDCNFNLNAIIIVARPIPSTVNNVFTGGYIKSENKIFNNCTIIKNLQTGVIITWFGYDETSNSEEIKCNIIYGISDKNLKTSFGGKIVPLSYPNDFKKWPKNCLSKFLEEQSFSFNFDFKLS